MKRLAISLIFAASTSLVVAQCGMEPMTPMPPIGCNKLEAQCQCDANGNCYWVFVCADPSDDLSPAFTWIPSLLPANGLRPR